jgi:hypothetical protein
MNSVLAAKPAASITVYHHTRLRTRPRPGAQLITLLVTDLGVLTPAAVSDELIKLYY